MSCMLARAREKLTVALSKIKRDYEDAIKSGGTEAAHSLIRSKKLIGHLHEYIKNELILNGVDSTKIYPPLGQSRPELKMVGFLKSKAQDICVLPSPPRREVVKEGVLIGQEDPVGRAIMNESISINIRSQLSSLGKNFDTLYERTFAEALNLHMRAPKLVMGEMYMVPFMAYDADAINRREVDWTEPLPLKYIPAFRELNFRERDDVDAHKYERVCLLIVDFRKDPPEVIDSSEAFASYETLDEETVKKATLSGLTISDFFSDLLKIYDKRNSILSSNRSMKIYSKPQHQSTLNE